jgi:hypothetical protein
VAEVRLDRAQDQRPGAIVCAPVGRHDRVGFDRIAELRAGAMGFNDIDLGCAEASIG